MNRPYVILKIALGIRAFPGASRQELANRLNTHLKTISTYFYEAEMVSRSWLPTLVTPEQLQILSGADLTVLYYLYTAEPGNKVHHHCYNVNMCDKTFEKALRNLRAMQLIEPGTRGKINMYNINKLVDRVDTVLN
jgi:hypothetical protein